MELTQRTFMAQRKVGSPAANIWEVISDSKQVVHKQIKENGFTINVTGIGRRDLAYPIDLDRGFWADRGAYNKPPRWIIHVDATTVPPVADFAQDKEGTEMDAARTLGYINANGGTCVAFGCRVLPLLRYKEENFHNPDWEWFLVLGFSEPLPAGTGSELISDFRPKERTILYQGQTRPINSVSLITAPVEKTEIEIGSGSLSYNDVTDALTAFLGGEEPQSEVEQIVRPGETSDVN